MLNYLHRSKFFSQNRRCERSEASQKIKSPCSVGDKNHKDDLAKIFKYHFLPLPRRGEVKKPENETRKIRGNTSARKTKFVEPQVLLWNERLLTAKTIEEVFEEV